RAVRGARPPGARPAAPAPGGRPAEVTASDKAKTVHKVADLQPLYRFADRSERLVPTLLFQKTVKVDLAKLDRLSRVGEEGNGGGLAFDGTLESGKSYPLTPIQVRTPVEGEPAPLERL